MFAKRPHQPHVVLGMVLSLACGPQAQGSAVPKRPLWRPTAGQASASASASASQRTADSMLLRTRLAPQLRPAETVQPLRCLTTADVLGGAPPRQVCPGPVVLALAVSGNPAVGAVPPRQQPVAAPGPAAHHRHRHTRWQHGHRHQPVRRRRDPQPLASPRHRPHPPVASRHASALPARQLHAHRPARQYGAPSCASPLGPNCQSACRETPTPSPTWAVAQTGRSATGPAGAKVARAGQAATGPVAAAQAMGRAKGSSSELRQ